MACGRDDAGTGRFVCIDPVGGRAHVRDRDQRIKALVEKEGSEKALVNLFDDEPCSYQLFENTKVKEGERSFPCPYKSNLEHGKKWLKTFSIEWSDVCNKWCIPIWKRSADKIGIKIEVKTGETCSVRLQNPEKK